MDFAVKMAETEDTRISGDPVKAEKMEAMKKYRRIRVLKKYVGYAVVSATTAAIMPWFPPILETMARPLRHLCFVVLPGIGVLCGNHGFLFLLSNLIIMILAVMSGMLSSSASASTADLYDEFVRKNESRPRYYIVEPVPQVDHGDREDTEPKFYGRSNSEKPTSTVHQRRARKPKREDTSVDHKMDSSCEEKSNSSSSSSSSSSADSSASSSLIVLQTDGNEPAMSDEELNRRVENFIAEFNRKIRQESLARHQEMVARGSK